MDTLFYLVTDPTFLIVLPAVILAIVAQSMISSTFRRFSDVTSVQGITACEMAMQMLDAHGIKDVSVIMTEGVLTDHFDPKRNVLRLSQSVYDSTSIAALAVAAHEVGHAVQFHQGSRLMKMRIALVPYASIGSHAAFPLLFIGYAIQFSGLIYIAMALYAVAVLFELVTLPLEMQASSRARVLLQEGGYLTPQEAYESRKVLTAASLTYLAAAFMGLLQLLRYFLLARFMKGPRTVE